MPVWQELREELKGQNFEIITVACDTKDGAAESWIQDASPTHPSLIDTLHRVAELYNTRNVPAVFWIDEQGRIVRANDPVYVRRRNRETGEFTIRHDYLNAVRDWVAQGPQSIYVQSHNTQDHLYSPTQEDAQAMAYFRLATYLDQQGHGQDAVPYFKEAHALKPENWNYKRQAFNLVDAQTHYGTTLQEAIRAPDSPPFYRPLELSEPPA